MFDPMTCTAAELLAHVDDGSTIALATTGAIVTDLEPGALADAVAAREPELRAAMLARFASPAFHKEAAAYDAAVGSPAV